MVAPAVIALPATLTLAEARATLAQLGPQLQAAADPVLDASALRHLDSSALALLLECSRQASAAGRRLGVHGAPPKLVQLAQLYGVAELLGLAGPVAPAA